ncbi:hypothetical protein K491DRAFT_693050 [Lophiostoma macrostomum CBS 122681]|uniref:Uncharacterized protein n=1 Tax=Lophiostoma macrostomum CBS 122681 TaxID=1314788 RepID=A0A6A6T5K4_9PLEO|nr:hypothetical protein K491DRAFT_693050 [Lophiostoma macrostomum CBS 122681]
MLQQPVPRRTDASATDRIHEPRLTGLHSLPKAAPPDGIFSLKDGYQVDEPSSRESRDVIEEFPIPESSPTTSRPDSPFTAFRRSSIPSTATSASIFGGENAPERKSTEGLRRPSILSRFRSRSVSESYTRPHRLSIQPLDFQFPTEEPEKHFIDPIGMVIPGVCNRRRCSHPLSHFVTNWRLCEPVEYTTALADHGITHNDHDRLLAALVNFLETLPPEHMRKPKGTRLFSSRWWSKRRMKTTDEEPSVSAHQVGTDRRLSVHDLLESSDHFHQTEYQAARLNKLLAEITFNLRARGLPVMICIASFSLFVPNRISEALVQILHVPFESPNPSSSTVDAKPEQRLSFVDPSSRLIKTQELKDHNILVSRRRLSHQSGNSSNPDSSSTSQGVVFHHHQLHLRDKTRPWPLWPNAIPTRKRGLMEGHAERYGVDPYFRAWMRANINSRTTSTSYAQYMIEKEDNPFVNTRLEYVNSPPNTVLLWNFLTKGYTKWKAEYPGTTNRSRYEHNVRLECRKTVEHGSRLRIARFSFRNPLYPPYTPEMSALGLTESKYNRIISHIESIRRKFDEDGNKCAPYLKQMYRQSAEEAVW